jgi:hypothetical protein
LPNDDDDDESSEEEEGSSNRSNAALTRQSKKKKKCGRNLKETLSALTMRLGSDFDSHADCCVCGKEVLVLNGFDR